MALRWTSAAMLEAAKASAGSRPTSNSRHCDRIKQCTCAISYLITNIDQGGQLDCFTSLPCI